MDACSALGSSAEVFCSPREAVLPGAGSVSTMAEFVSGLKLVESGTTCPIGFHSAAKRAVQSGLAASLHALKCDLVPTRNVARNSENCPWLGRFPPLIDYRW